MPHLGEFTKKKHSELTEAADLHAPEAHASSHESGGSDEIDVSGLTPKAHKTSHQDGGSDEIDLSGLAGQQIFVPYNAKIADINEDDTDKHTLDLETALSETRKIIGVILQAARILGSGELRVYPNEGAVGGYVSGAHMLGTCVIKNGTQRLQYKQTVANDDFDLYCFGYIVEA